MTKWEGNSKEEAIYVYKYIKNQYNKYILYLNKYFIYIWGESCSVVYDSLWPHGLYTVHEILQARILSSLSLLQGIFPTQELNPGLPHCRRIPAEPPGKPFPSPGDLPYPGIEPGSSSIVGRRFYRLSHWGSYIYIHVANSLYRRK